MSIKEAFPLFQTFALAFALIAMLFLCTPARASDITDIDPRPQASSALSKLQQFTDRASDLAVSAMGMIGIHYKYGGNSPENGLDCSGLVRYVFKDAWGVNVPRTAAELSRSGEKVDKQDLKPGDLVFYNTLRRSFSHVGIYLGDNKFIHAPSSGGKVRIESMDLAYWKSRFNGARRINDPEPDSYSHQ
ncbi:C40 family peptidase [Collimonas antrihumi]|uniref:C40 family peptidase n=1 Tax=Collimonas antrihumi TaxID=1940615 RepID=UPI001B8C38BA|nr:C40 family peptidase [Collimonas antrihumi]